MEPIEILLAGGAIAALGGVVTALVTSGGEAIRDITRSAIVSTLKLQDQWDEIVDEAEKQYEAETGKSKESADKETQEVGEEAKGTGEVLGSTVTPV